jgi:hypothetical protein
MSNRQELQNLYILMNQTKRLFRKGLTQVFETASFTFFREIFPNVDERRTPT